jgi:hypothetical protein
MKKRFNPQDISGNKIAIQCGWTPPEESKKMAKKNGQYVKNNKQSKPRFKVEDFQGKKVALLCTSEEERKVFLAFLKKNYSKELSGGNFEECWGTKTCSLDSNVYDCFCIDKIGGFLFSTFNNLNFHDFQFLRFCHYNWGGSLEEMKPQELKAAGYKRVSICFKGEPRHTRKGVIVKLNYGEDICNKHQRFIEMHWNGRKYFQSVDSIDYIKENK